MSLDQMKNTRSGGPYIPPARLKAMQAQIEDKSGEAYQRITWEALKKRLNGLINKANTSNIKEIVLELFGENLIRGRGLFVRSLMKAQHASPMFTPIYVALVAIINTKLPAIGALLITRLISAFQKAYRRNDKSHCLSITTFIAHLVNQQVAHEIVALQILALLLERPTDDSVEVAIGFMREIGAYLTEASPKATHAIFERFRSILHESEIDKRVQYMIEVLFQIRKDKFKNNPIKPGELDLVEDDEQLIHYICLDDELNCEEMLDVFKFDKDFLDNEEKYVQIRKEILGEDDESGEDEEEGDGEEEEVSPADMAEVGVNIIDNTETNMVNLRKTIYLTIMSSLDFEEACHKLLKMSLKPGQEIHLCAMVVECCSQERMYEKYYGLIGERFCKLNKTWAFCFAEEFANIYSTVHRYETNRIRNIAKFFAHLLATDALPWTVLQTIRLTEEDTTSSSRIFIKILFQELAEFMGMKELRRRLEDPYMEEFFAGIFPLDDARNIRFSINYFTSIGMGPLTERMREVLQKSQTSYSSDSDSSQSPSPPRRKARRLE